MTCYEDIASSCSYHGSPSELFSQREGQQVGTEAVIPVDLVDKTGPLPSQNRCEPIVLLKDTDATVGIDLTDLFRGLGVAGVKPGYLAFWVRFRPEKRGPNFFHPNKLY